MKALSFFGQFFNIINFNISNNNIIDIIVVVDNNNKTKQMQRLLKAILWIINIYNICVEKIAECSLVVVIDAV